MTSSRGNITKGRDEVAKYRKEMILMGEQNSVSLYQLQLDMANSSPDENNRRSAQQFLLDKILPKATPLPSASYVKFDLIPMNSIADIKLNEVKLLEIIANGEVSLEQGQKFFSMTEQARKTFEATDIIKLIGDIDVRLKENGM